MDKCECSCHGLDEGLCENCIAISCTPKKYTKEEYEKDRERIEAEAKEFEEKQKKRMEETVIRNAESEDLINHRREDVYDTIATYGNTLNMRQLLATKHGVTVQTIDRDIKRLEDGLEDWNHNQRVFKFGYRQMIAEKAIEGAVNSLGLRILRDKDSMTVKELIESHDAMIRWICELRDNSGRGALEDITKINKNIDKWQQKHGDLV